LDNFREAQTGPALAILIFRYAPRVSPTAARTSGALMG
jgi:hypothetical protein